MLIYLIFRIRGSNSLLDGIAVKTKLICVFVIQVEEMEKKLVKLRGGVALVNPEERKAVEDMFSEKLSQWRKRKRMFKELWDTLTENSPKDLKEFKVLSF